MPKGMGAVDRLVLIAYTFFENDLGESWIPEDRLIAMTGTSQKTVKRGHLLGCERPGSWCSWSNPAQDARRAIGSGNGGSKWAPHLLRYVQIGRPKCTLVRHWPQLRWRRMATGRGISPSPQPSRLT